LADWLLNAIVLAMAILVVASFAAAGLWRLGAWHIGRVERLTVEEGLGLGAEAPELAAHTANADRHLFFKGQPTFLVFGAAGCRPCDELLEAAAKHPATSRMRLVYLNDTGETGGDFHFLRKWEIYRFDDTRATRAQWSAPVSPYFHVISSAGRIVDKGIANRPEHLDRLLALEPATLAGRGSYQAVHASEDDLQKGAVVGDGNR
jgi:hypothetical protein